MTSDKSSKKKNKDERTSYDIFKSLAVKDTATLFHCTTSYVYSILKDPKMDSSKAVKIRQHANQRYEFYKGSSETAIQEPLKPTT